MARFGNETVKVGAISVRGRGVTGDATEGIAMNRGERRRVLDSTIPSDGFVERAQLTLAVDAITRGTRGGGANAPGSYEAPVVVVGPAKKAPGELGQIALVDDGGFCYIVRPLESGDDAGAFEIPIGDGLTAHRGFTQLVGRIAVRIVGLFAKKAVEQGTARAIQAIEQRLRPCRLRSFTRTDHRRDPDRTGAGLLEGGPALLLIHGINSNSSRSFRFDDAYLESVGARYGGRIVAFDHPSLSLDPRVNAKWLAEQLDGKDVHEIDVLAHCRGGLVARELLALLGSGSGIVRSVVFVATPNNGTPLADADRIDGFLSMATNVTAVIPDNPITDAIGIGLEVVREYAGGVLEAIDGITCMKPGSDQLRALAKHGSGDTVFRAIATHYEPRSDDGRLRRAADFVMDKAFRGQANDLLVPTRSTYLPSDRFEVPVDQRLVLASSFGVSHCTFWPDARVRRQLDEWLDPGVAIDAAAPVESEHTDPAAEIEEATHAGRPDLAREGCERLRGDLLKRAADELGGTFEPAAARSRDVTRKASAGRGTVVLLPGILGSRLRVARSDEPESTTGELVWFNKWSLVRGGFRRLKVGDEQHRVTPDGLMREYAPLFSHLASWWDVQPFAYDWRLSINDLAGHLGEFLDERQIDIGAADDPVHLVGHSMGGLVARAYIGMHRDRWERGSGRLVQLGTPNWGSFAMVAAVLGDEWAVRALAAADVFGSKDDVLAVFRSFPSVYQLFPSPLRMLADGGEPPHAVLYGPEGAWYRRDGDDDEASSVRSLIAAAKEFHATMAKVRGDDRVVFVAGDSQPTPYRARVDPSGKVSFGVTSRGDGRVPHDFGYADMGIADESTFFVETKHGDLASDERVLRAIDDLLERGTTDSLAKQPAGGVRARPDADNSWIGSDDLERSLGLPVPSSARDVGIDNGAVDHGLDLTVGLYVGGGRKQPTAAALRVRVVHGSLEQAKYAVAAGRYKGIPIDGALSYLNHRLGDALRDLQDLDLLPADAGSAHYVPPLDIGTYPKGAIVVGLGEFGQLSATRLARAMERGTIEYALAPPQQHRQADDRGLGRAHRDAGALRPFRRELDPGDGAGRRSGRSATQGHRAHQRAGVHRAVRGQGRGGCHGGRSAGAE